eukprot:TRINITY_DN1517_c0_g3_i1.p1 TRINITY_DN1517_c0_g3~~TRINITY_DN1517_c0_g3_i1.p1  ORF type:complete len:347 (-),score=44.82 TRINITY_DN1517_c0_g3_i1:516-1556(-)
MGACAMKSRDPGEKRIEEQIKEDRKKMATTIKLLLLGAGESGKSTIAKQLRIINVGDFSEADLREFKTFIHENIKDSMKCLIDAAERLGCPLKGQSAELANKIMQLGPEGISPESGNWCKTLWKDPQIQATYKRNNEFQLNDNAKYTLENIERLAGPDYVPTQQDALHCRVRTTGVSETRFTMGKREVVLIDVGGQRAERRKWINCFDNVTAVLFCVGMSEYDMKLAEDDETNRLHESMKLFDSVCNKWFTNTTVIIFLNKRDLFEEKITRVPLTVCFPEFPGPNDFDTGSEYIRKKMEEVDQVPGNTGRLYSHITCATDTTTFRLVFDAIKETLVNTNLQKLGLL